MNKNHDKETADARNRHPDGPGKGRHWTADDIKKERERQDEQMSWFGLRKGR